MEFEQRIDDQRKIERKLRLPHRQLTDVERVILRAQRQERLEGVIPYVRDALRNHGQELFREKNGCA